MSRLPIYDTRDWKDRTSKNVRSYNPICQHLNEDGSQCQQGSRVTHHLVDPKDAPEKAHDWANLVAVCFKHHPGGQRGATDNERYCATVGPLAIHYHHGHILPTWHKQYVPPAPSSISTIGGTTTSSVSQSQIDAALGDEWL